MRKFYLICCVILFFSFTPFSQSLIFCEDVDANGVAINYSNEFWISDGGGYITFLVYLANANDCSGMEFQISRKEEFGNSKTYEFSALTERPLGKMWFYRKVFFSSKGRFWVEVVDCNGNSIADAVLYINER
ncbi:MAG: hypothetical protein HBSAPP04_02100 [Ignavibacteriaceae bacterium]|nr:MAG: hypothetical protein EDM75_06730 [Chlorobiota bacterium]GJQ31371.1 MAG: hypothetical protein HBSAPP04_02100 [Ignavibacteriaceae bacterium]